MGEARDVSKRYFQLLSEGDVDAAVELVDDKGDFRSPMGNIKGREQVRAFLGGFEMAFPRANYDIEHVFEDGDKVAMEGVYRGTHSGPLMTPDGGSIAPTGRQVSAPFVTVFEVSGGLITSHRPYWDLAGFMAQLTG
jgi:steroid delta-isomerase-like uncharacterized protein